MSPLDKALSERCLRLALMIDDQDAMDASELAVGSKLKFSLFLASVRFGDGEWKPSGVTVEPDVNTRIIDGKLESSIAELRVRPRIYIDGLILAAVSRSWFPGANHYSSCHHPSFSQAQTTPT